MKWFKRIIADDNESARQNWLREALSAIPPGVTILDAGAGELKNRRHCLHLVYVSQDACQYDGVGRGDGLQTGTWDTQSIDIVSDIASMPVGNGVYDAVLCSEVFEHIPDPIAALKEFARVLKPGGTLILTAPFASVTHMAPYYYSNGFARAWYEYHLPNAGFEIERLEANGDWYAWFGQECFRFASLEAKRGRPRAIVAIPFAFAAGLLARVCGGDRQDLGCFGWHCVARRMR